MAGFKGVEIGEKGGLNWGWRVSSGVGGRFVLGGPRCGVTLTA